MGVRGVPNGPPNAAPKSEASTSSARSDVSPPFVKGSILVISSDPSQGRYLCEMLQSVGYRVDLTSGVPTVMNFPPAAIQGAVLYSSRPHCWIEHVCEICSALRRAAPNLPVIVVGPNDVEAKVKLFNLGADDYVVEPFDRTEFLARIDSLIRRLGTSSP